MDENQLENQSIGDADFYQEEQSSGVAPEVETVAQRDERYQRQGYIDNVDDFVRITGKSADQFRPKEQYDAYGSLLNKLKDTETKLDKATKALEAMGDLYSRIESKTQEQMRKEYEDKLAEAIDMGDHKGVYEANQKLYELTQQEQMKIAQQTHQEVQNAVAAFEERNKDWYSPANAELQAKAHELDNLYTKSYPNESLQERFLRIENEIRRYYLPKNMPNPVIPRSSSNENRSAADAGNATFSKLSTEDRNEYEEMKTQYKSIGIDYKKEDFIKYLRKYGRVK